MAGIGLIMIQVMQDNIDHMNGDKENIIHASNGKQTIKQVDS